MIITNNTQDKDYSDGEKIAHDATHYNHVTGDIIIYLPSVLEDSKNYNETIDHVFAQHVSHEVLHKVLYNHIGIGACTLFDNLCYFKTVKKDIRFSFKSWFGGMDGRR